MSGWTKRMWAWHNESSDFVVCGRPRHVEIGGAMLSVAFSGKQSSKTAAMTSGYWVAVTVLNRKATAYHLDVRDLPNADAALADKMYHAPNEGWFFRRAAALLKAVFRNVDEFDAYIDAQTRRGWPAPRSWVVLSNTDGVLPSSNDQPKGGR